MQRNQSKSSTDELISNFKMFSKLSVRGKQGSKFLQDRSSGSVSRQEILNLVSAIFVQISKTKPFGQYTEPIHCLTGAALDRSGFYLCK